MSLAAVNQMCVIHEAMNGCKNLKIHCRIANAHFKGGNGAMSRSRLNTDIWREKHV